MSEQDSAEKTEKATLHKVREARKKGMVAKSQDVNSLLIMAAGLLLMYAVGERLIWQAFDMSRDLFLETGRVEFQTGHLLSWAELVFFQGIAVLAAYIAPLMLVAVLASWLQTGPVISVFPLKPDVNKLNPITGFKRIFSTRLLIELIKSLLKISLFGVIVYFTFVEFVPGFMGLAHRSPRAYTGFFLESGAVLIFRILLALLLIALIDLLFSRWEYQKKLRMSKKELKDEYKRHDGDPLIRQKRKEISKELLNRSRSLGNIAGADVVITNPTHFAVAIQYDREKMPAPKTVGKGMGGLAARIREIAGYHSVPVVESPPLARRLYRSTKVGGYIHPDDYIEVARILRDVYAKQESVRGY